MVQNGMQIPTNIIETDNGDVSVIDKKITQRKIWLFQANPSRYDIFSELKNQNINIGTWLVTRYENEISEGDTGIIWVSGPNAGIYAIIHILSRPQYRNEFETSQEYWKDREEAQSSKLRIVFRYWLKLNKPILKKDIEDIEGLKNLSILKQPQGTNFSINSEEWKIIANLINNQFKDFPEEPRRAYSWTILPPNIVIKKMDKSTFLHYGSGVPTEIRDFFGVKDKNSGHKTYLRLIHKNTVYEGDIELTTEQIPRSRLFWGNDFLDHVQSEFPKWYEYFDNNGDDNENTPVMILEKTGEQDKYSIEMVDVIDDKINNIESVKNIIRQNLSQIKKFHYAQKAKPEHEYWVAFYRNTLEKYVKKFGENFNLIIYGAANDPFDFFSIPFSKLKDFLDPTKIIPEYEKHWVMNVQNGILTIWGSENVNHLNVEEFYQNVNNIPQVKNLLVNREGFNKMEYEKLRLKPIDVGKFIESVQLDSFSGYRPQSIHHPEKIKVSQLLDNCSSGDWVLPHFQRYFEWKQNDIRLFLEAIFNNYYVGAFLLWETEREPEVGIQPIQGIEIKGDLRPRSIILDGQQRITSVIYAVTAPKNEKFPLSSNWNNTGIHKEHPSYFYIDFVEYLTNLQSSEIIRVFGKKVSREICFDRMLFPFSELQSYNNWLFEFEASLENKTDANHKKIFELRNVMRKKIESILDFEFPYISLPTSLSLDQVTDIFLGVNTRGKPLDVFDLLIARLYKYKIELKKLWENTRETYPNINRYARENKKIPEYILLSMSLCYSSSGSAKKADILDVYKNIFENTSLNFEDEWNEFSKYTDLAIKKLENLGDGFGVRSEKDLPYASIIPILSSLLKTIETQPNPTQCYKKLEKWYWASIFTSSYSSAVETQMASDFKEMKEWFVDNSKIPSSISNLKRDINNLEFRSVKSESNVKYRGVLSLIALAGAKDFASGLRLENARKNEKDHIFPKSDKEFNLLKNINSVLNITWNSAETNKKIKFVKRPNVFIKEFISKRFENKEDDFIQLLETHLINREAYGYLLENNFEGFINEREKVILQKIKDIFEIKEKLEIQTLISPETPFSNKKIYSDTIKNCSSYIHWIDKYFSKIGLEILIDSTNFEKIKEIKILMSQEKVDEKFRDAFKDFKLELQNKGISVELRVIGDKKIRNSIHDRWIIAENVSYNIPSPDTIMRGQYSEIKQTTSRPPFDEWWLGSKDIINDWNEILNAKKQAP